MDAQDPLKAGRCDFLNSWQRAGGTLEISAKVSAAASSIIRCLSFLPRLDPKLLIASKPLLQSFCSFFCLKIYDHATFLSRKKSTCYVNHYLSVFAFQTCNLELSLTPNVLY